MKKLNGYNFDGKKLHEIIKTFKKENWHQSGFGFTKFSF